MSNLLPMHFERPGWLLLLLLIVPVYWMARRSIGGLSRGKATFIFAARVIIIFLLTAALAHPVWEKRGEGLTVTLIIDRSQSIPLPLKNSSLQVLQKAAQAKERREDRLAVITIAKEAQIVAMPDSYSTVSAGSEDFDLNATNLAAGVRLAMAIAPDDTANRIVLVSDGNETEDSIMAAAEIAAANNVPIDVVVLEYQHDREVVFERLIAPARVRKGQTINLQMVLRSQHDVTGTLRLWMNDVPVNLSGDGETEGLRVQINAGPAAVFPVPLKLDSPGPQRFTAVFEPDNLADDTIERNNTAVAVTFVAGEGKMLVIDDGSVSSQYFVQAMRESNIDIDIVTPDALSGGLVYLAGYDAVVLANVPRTAFDDEKDKMLHVYVHDLGGGLIMLGGDQSFGAGYWIGSELAKALPVELDPPHTRQMVRGALALIMHSCEMPQGNYWGQQVAISAIKALSSLDYVGIVEFNWNPNVANLNGSSWALPMSLAGDKSAAINAAKKMVVGDMPDFESSMQLALDGLLSVRAGQRHAIIISDGDPSPPTQALLNKYVQNKVTVTTVMVAGHGSAADRASMNATASVTGGNFYNVVNPRQLPEIFIKEAQVVSRSLIQEGDLYQPQIRSSLHGPVEGFSSVPAIDGYVLTAPRKGLAQTPIFLQTSEGTDPIYAYWNYGLGKSIAYTSDLSGRWGARWASWERFRSFWEQSARWVMRPSSPANFHINTRQEGDLAIVEVEALDADAAFLNFMQTNASVINPHNEAQPLALQQVGPGRYRGQFRTSEAGAYLVNVSYAAGASEETAIKGHVQAAVSVPYSREFRDVRHNAAKLGELARRTTGRELTLDDPTLLELFDATDLEFPKSPREVWDLMAIIAATLFLLDVAARRVSIDPKWLAALVGRAVGRRTETSAETVAAWKRARSQVSHRTISREQIKPTAAEKKVRFEASEEDAQRAIDIGSQTPADTRAAPPMPVKPKSTDALPQQEDGDYTSRLLAAKRRARGKDQQSDDGGKEQPNG